MKITIEPYAGGTYSSSNDAEDISEVVQLFKGLLVSAGFHPNTVDEYIRTEQDWYPEEDEKDISNG